MNWVVKNSGLTKIDITSFIQCELGLLAGTFSGGVFLSGNNGASWSELNTGLPQKWITSLAVSGKNIFAGCASGVYLYNNSTSTWVAVNKGLTYPSVLTLLTNGTTIFAGTNRGIYVSKDNGANWTAMNIGLSDAEKIYSLVVSGANIYAGTGGAGIWKRSLSEITGIAPTNLTNEMSLYPNPANDFVSLSLDKNVVEPFKLNIYNIAGVLVKSEIIEKNHTKLNIDELKTGVYFVETNADAELKKTKLIIQR